MPLAMCLLVLLYVVARNSHRALATVAVIAVAVRRMQLPCNRTQHTLKLLRQQEIHLRPNAT